MVNRLSSIFSSNYKKKKNLPLLNSVPLTQNEPQLGTKRKSESLVNDIVKKVFKGIKNLAINTAKSIRNKSYRRGSTIQPKPQIDLDLDRVFEDYIERAEAGRDLETIDKKTEHVLRQMNQYYGYSTKLEKQERIIVTKEPCKPIQIIAAANEPEIEMISVQMEIDENHNNNKVYLPNNPLRSSTDLTEEIDPLASIDQHPPSPSSPSIIEQSNHNSIIINESILELSKSSSILDMEVNEKTILSIEQPQQEEDILCKDELYEGSMDAKVSSFPLFEQLKTEESYDKLIRLYSADSLKAYSIKTLSPLASQYDDCGLRNTKSLTNSNNLSFDAMGKNSKESLLNLDHLFNEGDHFSRVAIIIDMFEHCHPLKPGEDFVLDSTKQ